MYKKISRSKLIAIDLIWDHLTTEMSRGHNGFLKTKFGVSGKGVIEDGAA